MPDGGDVGVIERFQQPGLALEAGHSFGIARECFGKELERNLAVQVEVVGHLDFAHASAAKLFTDSIVPQRFADHEELFLRFGQPVQCEKSNQKLALL